MIFSVAAQSGGKRWPCPAASLAGVAAGIVTGVQTGDMDEALKSAALVGSEGYKWGAITGVISGGASEAIALKGATRSGLTMNEAATIQRESRYPLDVIKQFKSMDQYEICKNAGLYPATVNEKNIPGARDRFGLCRRLRPHEPAAHEGRACRHRPRQRPAL